MIKYRFLPGFSLIVLLVVICPGSIGAESSFPVSSEIGNINWVAQTWNNCGPATLSMNLDRWRVTANQAEIAALIRPSWQDGHVSVEQLKDAAESYGMGSLIIPSGSLELIKNFIAAGIPVITPTWHIDTPRNQMGHYRLLHGYDNNTENFAIRDALKPVGYRMDYGEFDLLWRVFNRKMLVIFPAEKRAEAQAVLPTGYSRIAALEASLAIGVAEITAAEGQLGKLPEGMNEAQYRSYSFFNRANALTSLGRYEEAVTAMLRAYSGSLPWRILWYQSEALESMYRIGRYDWIVDKTTAALAPYPHLEELWYWRGMAEAARSEKNKSTRDEAIRCFHEALRIQPNWKDAKDALEKIQEG